MPLRSRLLLYASVQYVSVASAPWDCISDAGVPMTDYERIRRSCLKRGELWEDPEFPATQTSVFYHQTPPFQFVWKRPKVSYLFLWLFTISNRCKILSSKSEKFPHSCWKVSSYVYIKFFRPFLRNVSLVWSLGDHHLFHSTKASHVRRSFLA